MSSHGSLSLLAGPSIQDALLAPDVRRLPQQAGDGDQAIAHQEDACRQHHLARYTRRRAVCAGMTTQAWEEALGAMHELCAVHNAPMLGVLAWLRARSTATSI